MKTLYDLPTENQKQPLVSVIFEDQATVTAPIDGWNLPQYIHDCFRYGHSQLGETVLAISMPIGFKPTVWENDLISLFHVAYFVGISMTQARNLLLSSEFFSWYGSPVSLVEYKGCLPAIKVQNVPFAMAFLTRQIAKTQPIPITV